MTLPRLTAHMTPGLAPEDEAALTDLYRRGTPQNTLLAWERDLVYITAWKAARFAAKPCWPEEDHVALRFVLDHSADLTQQPGPAQTAALDLIARGLRRSLACPAPATLDRRIASWRAFHRMRNLGSPFAAPLVAAARQKARRANATPHVQKSPRPVTRDILEQLLASCDDSLRGLRDRAILMLCLWRAAQVRNHRPAPRRHRHRRFRRQGPDLGPPAASRQ